MTDAQYPDAVKEFLKPEAAKHRGSNHTQVAKESIDPYSGDWRIISGWAKAEIEVHRDSLETLRLDPIETEEIRGRIRQLRDLLSIDRTYRK